MSETFQRALNSWLADLTGLTVIASHMGAPRPVRPYIMTNITDVAPLSQVPRDVIHAATSVPEENGGTAESVTDIEYRVSVHAYGDDPTAILLPLVGVKHLAQTMQPMAPWKLHEVGRVQSVPEQVNAEWEDRAILRLGFHGIHREERVGDVAESVAGITVAEAQS